MKTLLDLLGINPLRPNVTFGGDDGGGGGGGGQDNNPNAPAPAATTAVPTFDTYYDAIDAGYGGQEVSIGGQNVIAATADGYTGSGSGVDTSFADSVLADTSSYMPPSSSTPASSSSDNDYNAFQDTYAAQSAAADVDPYGASTGSGFVTSGGMGVDVVSGGVEGVDPLYVGYDPSGDTGVGLSVSGLSPEQVAAQTAGVTSQDFANYIDPVVSGGTGTSGMNAFDPVEVDDIFGTGNIFTEATPGASTENFGLGPVGDVAPLAPPPVYYDAFGNEYGSQAEATAADDYAAAQEAQAAEEARLEQERLNQQAVDVVTQPPAQTRSLGSIPDLDLEVYTPDVDVGESYTPSAAALDAELADMGLTNITPGPLSVEDQVAQYELVAGGLGDYAGVPDIIDATGQIEADLAAMDALESGLYDDVILDTGEGGLDSNVDPLGLGSDITLSNIVDPEEDLNLFPVDIRDDEEDTDLFPVAPIGDGATTSASVPFSRPDNPNVFNYTGDNKFVYSGDEDITYGITATQNAEPFENIVFHHTGNNYPAENQVNYGKTFDDERGGRFGYHFVVGKDGTIIQGAPLDARTNHLKSSDLKEGFEDVTSANSIGISLVGASDDDFTPEQIAAAQDLARQLANNSDTIDNIYGQGAIQSGKMASEGVSLANELQQILEDAGLSDGSEQLLSDPSEGVSIPDQVAEEVSANISPSSTEVKTLDDIMNELQSGAVSEDLDGTEIPIIDTSDAVAEALDSGIFSGYDEAGLNVSPVVTETVTVDEIQNPTSNTLSTEMQEKLAESYADMGRYPGSVNAAEARLIQDVLNNSNIRMDEARIERIVDTMRENGATDAQINNFRKDNPEGTRLYGGDGSFGSNLKNVAGDVLNYTIKAMTYNLIDLEKMNASTAQKFLDAYKETGKFVYDSGNPDVVIGVEDSDGNLVRGFGQFENTEDGPVRVDQFEDIFGGESGSDDAADPCPEGMYLDPVTNTCMPIGAVDDTPSLTLGPADRPSTGGDDVITIPVKPDPVAPIRIRSPKQFAAGGAVTPNIDRFLGSMRG